MTHNLISPKTKNKKCNSNFHESNKIHPVGLNLRNWFFFFLFSFVGAFWRQTSSLWQTHFNISLTFSALQLKSNQPSTEALCHLLALFWFQPILCLLFEPNRDTQHKVPSCTLLLCIYVDINRSTLPSDTPTFIWGVFQQEPQIERAK